MLNLLQLLLIAFPLTIWALSGSTNVNIRSSFEGIGPNSEAPVGPNNNETRPNYTRSELSELNKKRKHCKEVHTPPPACNFKSADELYGRWYVASIPGLPNGSPICEKVDFFRYTSQHNFLKTLQIYLRNGSWYTQYQNGTITTPGKIRLELDLDDDGKPAKPRSQLTYTMIDFDPKHYITAFFCTRGRPVVPVLTRSKKPSMEVWARIFEGVLKAGAKLSWMDLFCRPSVATDVANEHAPSQPLPKLQYRASVDSREIIF